MRICVGGALLTGNGASGRGSAGAGVAADVVGGDIGDGAVALRKADASSLLVLGADPELLPGGVGRDDRSRGKNSEETLHDGVGGVMFTRAEACLGLWTKTVKRANGRAVGLFRPAKD